MQTKAKTRGKAAPAKPQADAKAPESATETILFHDDKAASDESAAIVNANLEAEAAPAVPKISGAKAADTSTESAAVTFRRVFQSLCPDKPGLPFSATGVFPGFGVFRGKYASGDYRRSAAIIAALCAAHKLPLKPGTALPVQIAPGVALERGGASDPVNRCAVKPIGTGPGAALQITAETIPAIVPLFGEARLKSLGIALQ